jgi:molybdate transport system regulatory protein
MGKNSVLTGAYSLRPRFRIAHGATIAFGPGKADLLEALQQTGSITKAAAQLKMSYMRAWTLIGTMNKSFREPLVVSVRGGTRGGGGARLTETGGEALALYRQMEEGCHRAVQADWLKFQKLLRAKASSKNEAKSPLRGKNSQFI